MDRRGEEEKREGVVGGRTKTLTFVALSDFEFTKSYQKFTKSSVGSIVIS